MTRREQIESDALWLLTSGDGSGLREVLIEDTTYWWPASDKRAFECYLRTVRRLGGELSLIPRTREDRFFVAPSSCFWVRVETRHAAEQLAAFEPKPTLILRDGETVKRTALWWLDRYVPELWTLKANERLAHALGGIRKHAALSEMFVPQDAFRGVQRVHVEAIRLAMYSPNEIVGDQRAAGKLKDAPDLEALRAKHRARREQRIAA